MQYSFKKIKINAPFPTTQCGHSCQTYLVSDFNDDLYARVTAFKDEGTWVIHYSMDLLEFDQDSYLKLQDKLRDHYHDEHLHVITSATHTHYANSVRDERYSEYLMDLLVKETATMVYSEKKDVKVSYQHLHTTSVGRSRISGNETNNETLCLVRFYEADDEFLNIVYYNCHPTILEAHTRFFSADYPGYVLKKLEETYPNTDFTFLQGPAGDISTRFTRDGQDYEAVKKLGNKLVEEIIALKQAKADAASFKLGYKEEQVHYDHEFTPIDLSKVRSDLSEREKETIRIGQQEREKFERQGSLIFGRLIKDAIIAALDLGCVKIIFFPNEIFSHYMDYIDKDREMLVSYSNGYGPYVLPIDFPYITYEMFTDTLTRASKERIIETLKNI